MTARALGWLAVATLAGAGAGLSGCGQADYSADIHNRTSVPVFAQLMVKANGKSEPAVLGASRRLGPGDRAFVGPVRTSDREGMAYLLVDTLPSQSKTATLDLRPGTTFLEVFDENGLIRVMPKP